MPTPETNAPITVGSKVFHRGGDGDALLKYCGPAVVLALDGQDEWAKGDCSNRPSAWIRYTSPEGYHRYRSVDECELETM